MSNKNHPFHLVEMSPWPILSAFTAMSLMGIIMLFHFSNPSLINNKSYSYSIKHMSMMTSYYSSKYISSNTHKKSNPSIKVWDNLIYYIWSPILRLFFPSMFPQKTFTLEIGMMWPLEMSHLTQLKSHY